MKALCFVWGFVAFSILGFTLSSKTETFVLQDFESNFRIVDYPEEFLPGWAANEVRNGNSRVFLAPGKGINGSNALGVQTTGGFDAQIYIKTTTIGLEGNIFSFYARTERNGSGNRPVYVYFYFSDGETDTDPIQIGTDQSFPNADTDYHRWELPIPHGWLERAEITVNILVRYGSGNGTAARWYMDDFGIEIFSPTSPELPPSEQPETETPSTFPALVKVEADSLNALTIYFDEPLPKELKSVTLSAGYGNPERWEVIGNSLILYFSDFLYANTYTLAIGYDIDSYSETYQLEFDLDNATPEGAIVINEFMADPNPKALVPPDPRLPTASNDEYIELINRTDKPIRLRGFTYNDSPLEDATVLPGEYVLLVSMSRKAVFNAWGKVVGVEGFRALPNATGRISIKDSQGNIIDSLTYESSWYGSSARSQGGWSLERKNPYVICSDRENWAASESPNGGTPGQRNSIYTDEPDTRPFWIDEVRAMGEYQIRVDFSKPLSPILLEVGLPKLNEELMEIDSVRSNTLWLSTSKPMRSDVAYTLRFEDLSDCFGQPLEKDSFSFVYDTEAPKIEFVGGRAETELVIYLNEPSDALFLPSPAAFQIMPYEGQIAQVRLARPDRIHLLLSDRLTLHETYELKTWGITDRFGNAMDTTRIEFYWEDQVDTVYTASSNTLRVKYKVEVDPTVANKNDNYLLNRNIGSPVAVVEDQEEQNAYLLIFDRDFPSNQPVSVEIDNLVDLEGRPISTFRQQFIWDTRPISISSITPFRPNRLVLHFNKALNPKSVISPGNYDVSPDQGSPTQVEILDPQTVQLDFSAKWEYDKSYQVRVRGLIDLYDNGQTRDLVSSFGLSSLIPVINTAYLTSPFTLLVELDRSLEMPFSFEVNSRPIDNVRMVTGSRIELVSDLPFTNEDMAIALHLGDESTIEYTFSNVEPELYSVQIMDERSLLLTFTDFLDPSNSLFPEKYQVNDRSVQDADLLDEGYRVVLTVADPLELGAAWSLSLGTLYSDGGKQISTPDRSGVYSDGISEVWINHAHSAILLHEGALSVENAVEGAFTFVDESLSVDFWVNRSQPRQLQLVFSEPLQPNRSYRIRIPPRRDGAGNYLSGSQREIMWDNRPPSLQRVEVLRDTEFQLYFNEPLDPVFALIPSFYELAGVHPLEVQLGPASHQVLLIFAEPIQVEGAEVMLKLTGIEDTYGNAIDSQEFVFSYEPPSPPGFRDIVINEIMPAPRESGSLPNVEYIELYNASGRSIQLGGLAFGNNRTFTLLPRYTLEAGEYLILCPANQVAQFQRFGAVMGVSPWPTMLNAGDEVWIGSPDGAIIDRMAYTNASFGSNSIAQAGYSLELVNPYYPCESPANIRPSLAAARGTPGKQNSVFDNTPDRTPPRLLRADPVDNDRLRLLFTKPVTERNLLAEFFLTPHLSVSEVIIDPDDGSAILLVLAEPFQPNQRYEIKVGGWTDCSGNALHAEASHSVFKIPVEAEPGDIVLNEILFNARIGGPKFVEIYNASDKYIDLKNWKLANTVNGDVANRRVISGQTDLLLPGAFRVLTTDSDMLHQHYPRGIAETFHQMSLPSYPIGSGTVILLNPDESVEERYNYHERHHHPLLREVRGVSLERLSVTGPADDPENWQSASATVGFATPGYRNSQVVSPNPLEQGIQISPKVFVPEGGGEAPFTTISYQLDRPGFLATLRIYATDGRQVRELCQNQLWGQSGFYTWDGTDERGARVQSGYYVVWVELFHPNGEVSRIKKTVVVGTKF